ncbi:MAG: amidohydrolase family protein, partial [Cellvibrionales bacterium]|nr:amidohydrolase family protein [Cellvibrionales bacterium]
AGVLPHNMGAWQFATMVARGMTPMDAIRSATSVAAIHMDLDKDIGAIEVGRYGDLIAVVDNPLTDVDALKSVSTVIKNGLIVINASTPFD